MAIMYLLKGKGKLIKKSKVNASKILSKNTKLNNAEAKLIVYQMDPPAGSRWQT